MSFLLAFPVGAEPPCQLIVWAAPPICNALGMYAVAPCDNSTVIAAVYDASHFKFVRLTVKLPPMLV